jgi:hypothetical protein
VVHRRRCGKANCRCADGAPHETTELNWSEEGRARALVLPADQVERVRAAVSRYRAAQAALREEADRALAALVEALAPSPRRTRTRSGARGGSSGH